MYPVLPTHVNVVYPLPEHLVLLPGICLQRQYSSFHQHFFSEPEQCLRIGPDTGSSAFLPKVLQVRIMSTWLQHLLKNHDWLQLYPLPRTRLVSVLLNGRPILAACYHSWSQMVECLLILKPLLPIPI